MVTHKIIQLLCDADELKTIKYVGKDLMPVADALQPIYRLLESASIEYVAPTSVHTDIIEQGPHYASIPVPIQRAIAKHKNRKLDVVSGAKRRITTHFPTDDRWESVGKCITIEFVLRQSRRSIHVHIHPLNSTHDPDEVVRLIWIWLQTLDAILATSNDRTTSCSRELHIYLYLTPFLKQWPKANQPEADKPKTKSGSTIEEIHVNSGFAFPCSESASGLNQIYVYREEEWFKVLIHETIHAFGVDFSAMSTNSPAIDKAIRALDTAFPGVMSAHNADKNCICVFEAYTECWAEWIAILFRVHEYRVHEYRENKGTWKSDFVRHLELERRWSMLQASRMGTWFASNPARMYRNRTPIFAYYVLKSVLMHHSVAFMAWCKGRIVFDMNQVESFGKFLRDHVSVDTPSSMKIEDIEGSSLRMSLWGD